MSMMSSSSSPTQQPENVRSPESSPSNPNPNSSPSSPIDRLEDDLLVEILHRLPCSKSATLCKCVCKRWYDLINPNSDSDLYFVHRFTRRKIDQNMKEPLGIINTYTQIGIEHLPSKITVPFKEHRHFFRSSFTLNFLPCEEPERICILASSSIGLLVCCPGIYDHSVYFICNPLTKQWLSLPPPPLSSQRARSFKNTYKGLTRVGFTYEERNYDDDDVGDDSNFVHKFRLVCVPARIEDIGEEGFVSRIEIEVFSSETWEWSSFVLQRQADPRNFVMPGAHHVVATCNGFVHWMDGNFIAFNPWCNSYHFIPTPPDNALLECIGQCQGRLRAAGFIHYQSGKETILHVWDLEDYGNSKWVMVHEVHLKDLTSAPKDSWLMKYGSSIASSQSEVIAFSPNNRDVVYLKCRNCVVMCDMLRRVWKVVGKIGQWKERRLHLVFPLVLPWWPTPVPMLPEIRREKLPDISWRVECAETQKLREEQEMEMSK